MAVFSTVIYSLLHAGQAPLGIKFLILDSASKYCTVCLWNIIEQSLSRSMIFSTGERCEVLQATASISRYLNFAAEKTEFNVFEAFLVGRRPFLDNHLSLAIWALIPGLPGIRWRLDGQTDGIAFALCIDQVQTVLMRQVALFKGGLNGIDCPCRSAGVSLIAFEALTQSVRGIRLSLGHPVIVTFWVAHLNLEGLVVLDLEASVVLVHVVEVLLRCQTDYPFSFGDTRSGRHRRKQKSLNHFCWTFCWNFC